MLVLKVNKYFKKTHNLINAINFKITPTKIIITNCCNDIEIFDRNKYELHIVYDGR